LPFINLGLVPEAASSLILPRMLGHLRASELLLLGDMFDAATAERYGIINKVSEPGSVDADAMAWATTLAAKAPTALRLSKALLKSQTATVADRMREEAADRSFVRRWRHFWRSAHPGSTERAGLLTAIAPTGRAVSTWGLTATASPEPLSS
jgi:enoyl-CoA hydratase/carnithine racemase